MAQICPTCGGNNVGCATCSAPPIHIKPPLAYTAPRPSLRQRLKSIIMQVKVWEVQGIDISKWNGTMNFAVTKTKCQYGIARYGYGNGWKDPKIDTYYADAEANDFPLGGYWFNNIGQDLYAHAQGFADVIRIHKPRVGIRLDFEVTSLGMQDTLDWMIALDQEVTRLTNLIAEIYSAIWFWNTKIPPTTYFSGRMNWPASWTDYDVPSLPRGWTKWGDWQWSADGNRKAAEYGSTNGDFDMDLDRSFYTVPQFNTKWGTHIQPLGTQPPIPPGVVPPVVIIGPQDINIRSAPNPSDPSNIMGIATHGLKWYPESIELDQYRKEWYRCGKNVFIKKELTRLP